MKIFFRLVLVMGLGTIAARSLSLSFCGGFSLEPVSGSGRKEMAFGRRPKMPILVHRGFALIAMRRIQEISTSAGNANETGPGSRERSGLLTKQGVSSPHYYLLGSHVTGPKTILLGMHTRSPLWR
jgi:hypothetical protein